MKNGTTLGLMALVAIASAAPAFATDPGMPGVDGRQRIQQERIGKGIESGQLTSREAVRLEREQARIERAERRAECDGAVTRKERIGLKKRQDRASRHIYREKHDAQTAK